MGSIKKWEGFKKSSYYNKELGLGIDISGMDVPDEYITKMEEPFGRAFHEMSLLEGGQISNKDENRMVGHYWLRNPNLSPTESIKGEIVETLAKIKTFGAKILNGEVLTQRGETFKSFLLIGIGGSALGPQLIADGLGEVGRGLKPFFFDNTDPDGFDRILLEIGEEIDRTLFIVISKSGGTKETRNGMVEVKEWVEKRGLSFSQQAVAITQEGSQLDKIASEEGWIKRFPMWDWVGGRTSVTSAVGLIPAVLLGIDIDGFLLGANLCDGATRKASVLNNPGAMLALAWYYGTNGKGEKDMVILPYKDRLSLFAKYLQQLIMESLGKGMDRDGNLVYQGISVYGNKGSTDQHAYIQQLIEGVNNFFATFIEVLKDRDGESAFVEPNVTSGDYLKGFILGTQRALEGKDRRYISVSLDKLNPFGMGVLIALYERAVGLYASLINVNAYHQPGVEGGKKAADKVIALKIEILNFLRSNPGIAFSGEDVTKAIGTDEIYWVFKLLEHLSANYDEIHKIAGDGYYDNKYVNK